MITCILHGELALKFGANFQFDCINVREVFLALGANIEQFKRYMNQAATDNLYYQIIVDGELVSADFDFLDPIDYEIHISPIIAGSGTVGKFILGAVLIVASFFMPATFLGVSSLVWGATGASILAGAIGEWISPNKDGAKNDTSYRLNGGGTRTYQGDPVPIAFGQTFTWAKNPPISTFVENETIPVGYDATA
jgi:predicted phage tail protein